MRALGAALALALAVTAASARERVIDFHSDVVIQANGDLLVTETIVVQAEGKNIKRGIYRDFPTDYQDRLGQRVRVGFEPLAVTHNGRAAPYVTRRIVNGVRVRIGEENVFIPHGRHTYVLSYRTTRQLGFFDEHDELYWNVNGVGWDFAFERLSAEVRLPRTVPASALKLEAYTGPAGARGRDYAAEAREGGASFRATRALAPRHGMTIVVAFPKGIVQPPGAGQRLAWWLADNRGLAAGLAGVLLLAAFLGWRWHLVGRDPRAGPKFPRYEPPPGIGPAGVRYVDRMGYDDRCFAAALLGLGARGYLRIREHGGEYHIERTGGEVEWLPGERHVKSMLYGPGKPFVLKREHSLGVQAVRDQLRQDLKQQFDGRLFSRNRGAIGFGLVLLLVTLAAMEQLDSSDALLAVIGVAMVLVLALFWRLLPAYSVAGRKLQDHIEGLRYYLGVAEKDDLARLKAPERTPQEFAKFLPYALALGVEKTWADRFAAALGTAAVAAAVADYYSSGSVTDFGPSSAGMGAFADSIGDLGGVVSSASTPPGSSSGGSGGGGGGGGSSGGGGGGGGGGGW